MTFITEKTVSPIVSELSRLNKNHRDNIIDQCVKMAASRWIESDGSETEFHAFCLKHYINDPSAQKAMFNKIQEKIEKIYGLSLALYWSNAWSVTMQTGPLEPIDVILAEIDPNAHIIEDFYTSKLAFVILLNFPFLSLDEKRKLSNQPDDRMRLAQCRLAERCQFRIPFEVSKKESTAVSATFQYLGHLLFDLNRVKMADNHRLLDKPMQVDCHWGLRDQINLQYQEKNGFPKQQLLAKMWERATLEEVPIEYYEDSKLLWDPVTNTLFNKDKTNPKHGVSFYTGHYAALKGLFEAKQAEDIYSPEISNFIARSFELQREFSEHEIRQRLTDFLTNPLLPSCAARLQTILQRPLCTFDVVFNQFGLANNKESGRYDDIAASKFPSLSDFQVGIPDILVKLGFTPELSLAITKQIKVVSCRTGGFSSFPKMRGGDYILAVSTDHGKMNYMAFATAMHELGHCVEAYLSSENIDHYLLGEVPSSAFTEAFAFLFDSKCLELLGIEDKSEEQYQNKILNLFWTAYLDCGIALVDLDCWQWMYAHPGFSVDELKTAVIQIARTIWNQYFSPIIGEKDSVILAGYSPMLINPLYMPEYALAIFIQTQLEHYLKDKILGEEMPRICGIGRVTPDAWMMNAVGESVSSKVLLMLTEEIL